MIYCSGINNETKNKLILCLVLVFLCGLVATVLAIGRSVRGFKPGRG
jgi:hypothetical protein